MKATLIIDKIMTAFYSDNFVDFKDRNIEVAWQKPVWEGHIKKHPELLDKKNCSGMIEMTVREPSIVLEGSKPGNSEKTALYYRELSRHQSFITYIKVSCGIYGRSKKRRVKSVFRETAPIELVVQEHKYPKNFKETWRNETTNIW